MLDGGGVRFGFTHGPIDAGGYVRQRLVIRHLSEATESDALADKLSLSDIAGRVHASPFHLARMFRARTGFSIHEYRNQLRLRYALDRVCEQGTDLSSIAVELGAPAVHVGPPIVD